MGEDGDFFIEKLEAFVCQVDGVTRYKLQEKNEKILEGIRFLFNFITLRLELKVKRKR